MVTVRANIVPLWSRYEQSFRSAISYPNPLQDATLCVMFSSPSGKMWSVPGFWDGGQLWRVRFSPDEVGMWTYLTLCSDQENGGLHQRSGTFICSPPTGGTRFERHGPLRLSANRRYLTHADGTPFFWLADTAWNGPLRSTAREWEHYIGERTRQGFTAVQWVTTQWISAPDGDLAGDMPFSGHERIAVDPAVFQRLDAKLDALNRAGLLGVPVLLWAAEWGDFEAMAINPGLTLPEDQCILLARYMVARWRAHNVAWILAGDGDYAGPKAERWRRIGRAVFADMPGALVTLHPCGLQCNHLELRDEAWLSIIGYQSCHFYDEEALAWHVSGPPATDWKEDPPRPFINLEPSYENILDMRNDTGRRFDARDVRRAMYWSLLVSPTAGVSYGGHGVWGWDDGGGPPVAHPTTGTPLPWREALLMPAAEQISHLANLFGSIEWWRLRPAPDLVAAQPGRTAPQRFIAASRSDAGDLALVYVPEDRRVELYLRSLNPGLSASWFDPRDGEFTPATPIDLQERSCFDTPTPGDWVLLFK